MKRFNSLAEMRDVLGNNTRKTFAVSQEEYDWYIETLGIVPIPGQNLRFKGALLYVK